MDFFSRSRPSSPSEGTKQEASFLKLLSGFLPWCSPERAQQLSLSDISLPTVRHEIEEPAPDFSRFCSSRGEPTMLSIRRVHPPEPDGSSQILFEAAHNFGGSRHSLQYALSTACNGDLTLKGTVTEVGRLPMVPGSYAPERPRVLIRFEFKAAHGSVGEARCLLKDAWNLVEVFTDQGLWGVDRCLEQSAQAIGRSQATVYRSRRFRQELADRSDTPEPAPFSLAEDDLDNYYSVRGSSEEAFEDIRDALRLLDSLSMHELDLQRGYAEDDTQFFLASGDDEAAELQRLKRLKGVRISEHWFSSKVRAEFFTPGVDPSSALLIRLSIPFSRRDEHATLSHLRLEILGPRKGLFLRERYVVRDAHDVLAVTEFSNNDELFRNLFRTFHEVNRSNISGQKKIESLLELLSEYDLTMRIGNVPAAISAARRAMTANFLRPQQEQL